MKRELKLFIEPTSGNTGISYCRAYPDEKGIETKMRLPGSQGLIAEPIPMKRELKHLSPGRSRVCFIVSLQSLSR